MPRPGSYVIVSLSALLILGLDVCPRAVAAESDTDVD